MLTQNTTHVVTFSGEEFDVHFSPAGSYGGWLIDVWTAYDGYDETIIWDAAGICLNGDNDHTENVATAQ